MILNRLKLGIFGQTAKFGQRPCLFHISNIGIKNKLTKLTVKILIRSRLMDLHCLQICVRIYLMPEFTRLNRVKTGKFGHIPRRIKSGKFGRQVNSDTHLQTVEIQMIRLLISRLIRIFTVCLVNLFFIPITEL